MIKLFKNRNKVKSLKTITLFKNKKNKPENKEKNKKKKTIKYKIIPNTKEINIVQNKKEPNNKESIIIVGNGPSVLKNNYGNIIDSFDNVVRINHYKPSKNVGRKLTHYIFSPWKQIYNSEINELASQIIIWNLIKKKEPIVYSNLKKTIYMNVKKINDVLVKKFKFANFPQNPLPSTGIVTILYFILLNKFEKIYIHGFDGLIPNKQLHFFDNKLNDEKVHSSKLELNFINYYIDQGIIIKLKDSEIIKNMTDNNEENEINIETKTKTKNKNKNKNKIINEKKNDNDDKNLEKKNIIKRHKLSGRKKDNVKKLKRIKKK